jgi:hypothetical protein
MRDAEFIEFKVHLTCKHTHRNEARKMSTDCITSLTDALSQFSVLTAGAEYIHEFTVLPEFSVQLQCDLSLKVCVACIQYWGSIRIFLKTMMSDRF